MHPILISWPPPSPHDSFSEEKFIPKLWVHGLLLLKMIKLTLYFSLARAICVHCKIQFLLQREKSRPLFPKESIWCFITSHLTCGHTSYLTTIFSCSWGKLEFWNFHLYFSEKQSFWIFCVQYLKTLTQVCNMKAMLCFVKMIRIFTS